MPKNAQTTSQTTSLISDASKVMLKILQARLQQYVNHEPPNVQAGFRIGRGTRDQIANICGIIRNRETSALLTMPKPLTVWITTNCRKFLKRWKYQSTLPASEKPICRSRSNRTRHRTRNWFQIGKGVRQGCTLSPCLFNFHAEYIMRNVGLDESQTGIMIAGRNINNHRYADNTTLMAESKEELKSLLMRVKRRVKKLA